MQATTQKTRPVDVMGPNELLTSAQLQARLINRGLTAAAARQAISRASRGGHGVWRSENLRLPRGERLFARTTFTNTTAFYKQAGEQLLDARPGLARCLHGLAENGVLNRVQAQRLVAAAVAETDRSSSPGFDAELAALGELGVQLAARGCAHEYLLGGGRPASPDTDEQALEALLTLRKESLLARVFTNRLRNQSVLSWNGCELPTHEKGHVVFNGQVFTAYGFSYLAPVVRFNQRRSRHAPCPVLIDTYLGRCTVPFVQSFLSRAEKATCRGKNRQPYLGVIAARNFEKAALQEAKQAGLMTVNFLQTFGDEALDAMVIVERLLGGLSATAYDEEAEEGAKTEFEKFTKALVGLKANPVVVDLCSIGFEMLAGLAIRAEGWEGVLLGQDVPFKETTRDVDVFGRQGDKVILIECKAYHAKKEVTAAEVKKFLTETVPSCREWWAKREGRPAEVCQAEIWTSGKVGPEALDALARTPLRKDTKAAILGRKEIIKRLPTTVRKRSEGFLEAVSHGGQEWGEEA